jgi:hypothetical protein
MVSSEVVSVWVECGPPSWFDKLTMRAPGLALTLRAPRVHLALSQSKGEVRATDLAKVR